MNATYLVTFGRSAWTGPCSLFALDSQRRALVTFSRSSWRKARQPVGLPHRLQPLIVSRLPELDEDVAALRIVMAVVAKDAALDVREVEQPAHATCPSGPNRPGLLRRL